MGYIAPIQMVQYEEYHKRVQAKSKVHDPMPVKFIPRISLLHNLRLGTNTAAGILVPDRRQGSHKEEAPPEKRKIVGSQTGKGLYVNEYI